MALVDPSAGFSPVVDDIEVSEDLAVRPPLKGRFEIRVGDYGWHRNAALLTKAQAKKLRDLLDEFLEDK